MKKFFFLKTCELWDLDATVVFGLHHLISCATCLPGEHQASGATSVHQYILIWRTGGKYEIHQCRNVKAFDDSIYISAGFDISECVL